MPSYSAQSSSSFLLFLAFSFRKAGTEWNWVFSFPRLIIQSHLNMKFVPCYLTTHQILAIHLNNICKRGNLFEKQVFQNMRFVMLIRYFLCKAKITFLEKWNQSLPNNLQLTLCPVEDQLNIIVSVRLPIICSVI